MFIPIFARLKNQFSIVLYSDCMENKFPIFKNIKLGRVIDWEFYAYEHKLWLFTVL